MANRNWVLTMVGAVVLGSMAVASVGAWGAPNRRNSLKVSAPIALPGVTLPAGTYTFELADPGASLDIVRVSNGDRSRVYLTGFTMRVTRPAGLPADKVLTFGESSRDSATRISAWYPIGESVGHQFVYTR